MTTTAQSIDPELLNRCMVVGIDESITQTAAIHSQQRFNETIEGYLRQQASDSIAARHRNAQRLLRRLPVFNPYAGQLSFVGQQTRHRRDHGKYLTLIKSITLLHQYQRQTKQVDVNGHWLEYLEVTRRDIALANKIADWALGRSIDELSDATRRLLLEIYDWVLQQAKASGSTVAMCVSLGGRFGSRLAGARLSWLTTLSAVQRRVCRAIQWLGW